MPRQSKDSFTVDGARFGLNRAVDDLIELLARLIAQKHVSNRQRHGTQQIPHNERDAPAEKDATKIATEKKPSSKLT